MSLQLPLNKEMTKGLVYPSFVHGASPWSPLDDLVPLGLAHWWDASLVGSVTVDGSGNISSWLDRIGSVAATQSVGANRPGYNAAGGYLDNTATARWLDVPYIATGLNHRWLLHVAYADISAATFSDGGIWAINGYSGGTGTLQPMVSYTRTGTIVRPNWGTVTGYSYINLSTADDAWHILCSRLDSGVHKAAVNGAAETTDVAVTLATSAVSAGRIGDFRWTTNSAGLVTYKVRHILIGTGDLTPELRDKLVGWAAWDSGITASLPAGHPYKTARPIV